MHAAHRRDDPRQRSHLLRPPNRRRATARRALSPPTRCRRAPTRRGGSSQRHANRLDDGAATHRLQRAKRDGRFHLLRKPIAAREIDAQPARLPREHTHRQSAYREYSHGMTRDRVGPAVPARMHATHERALVRASMRSPSTASSPGRSVVDTRIETPVTSRPPTATERSSFTGAVASAPNPIATASPESRIVGPA